ncbi:MAG TPA: xanthine dehydrogenase family protein molybdopterin-binding subunit, partial [bacterium]
RNVVIVNQPMVRTFSTGGGHGPEDFLVEGDAKIVTKKWQGYPPQNLNLIGKPRPPMPEVAIPRYLGKAAYATRVTLPNMLHVKLLTSPHPRARVTTFETAEAEKIPGVAYILSFKNAPQNFGLTSEPGMQGAMIAAVAADTEDLAEDAIAAMRVEYEVLPSAATIQQVMAPNAPDLRSGKGNLAIRSVEGSGDIEQGFRDADVIKEFTYRWAGATVIPMQPLGGVARWEGDKLTLWGMGQAIHPARAGLARTLGIDEQNIHYINKYNGGSFGAASGAAFRFYPVIARIAKVTGRPTKIVLPKDQELSHIRHKPENTAVFKVGAKRDGHITAVERTYYIAGGPGGGEAGGEGAGGGRSELYLHVIPNWKETGFAYITNTPAAGPARSNRQQEFKWAWEQMMDEMAEAVGMDPVQFRLLNVQKPGTKVAHTHSPWLTPMPETTNGTLTYDSYASVEVLEEGRKAIGWDKRNPVPGGNPGRFKRGFGMGMSQHHAGRVGYHEGEIGFEKVRAGGGGGGEGDAFQAEIVVDMAGNVVLHFGQPDSGTNHGTSMAILVAEILGFTTLDRIRLIWGDSALTPPSPGWHSGLTTQLQGGALNAAADKLRKDLLTRGARALGVDAGTLAIKDGVIAAKDAPTKQTTFAALVKANESPIRMTGRAVHPGSIGRALNRGIGACFAEVEVDTWTGNWRFLRAAYCTDTGNVINPLLGQADMHGALVESSQLAIEAIPWDREFPGTRHYGVGYLSYRLPTILDVPEHTDVFVNSLEPRWFFGCKGFAETTIGAVPGALANAIYNACGVRIREHPISKEKIMAGLKALRAQGRTA